MSISDIDDILAIDILGVVPDDQDIIVSTNRGEPVVTDSKSRAGQAYRNIVRRILGEEVPLMNLQERGVMNWFKRILSGEAQ